MSKTNKEYVHIAKQTMRGKWPRTLLFLLLQTLLTLALMVPFIYAGFRALSHLQAPILPFGAPYELYRQKSVGIMCLAMIPVVILSILTQLGMTQICLRPFQEEKVRFTDLLIGFRHPLRTLGNALLLTLRCGVFGALCFIPGYLLMLVLGPVSAGSLATIPIMIYIILWICVVVSYSLYYVDVQLLQLLHPELSIRQLHRRSRRLMKGHRRQYMRLLLRQWPVLLIAALFEVPNRVISQVAPQAIFLLLALQLLSGVASVALTAWLSVVSNAFVIDLDRQLDPPAESQPELPEISAADSDTPADDPVSDEPSTEDPTTDPSAEEPASDISAGDPAEDPTAETSANDPAGE